MNRKYFLAFLADPIRELFVVAFAIVLSLPALAQPGPSAPDRPDGRGEKPSGTTKPRPGDLKTGDPAPDFKLPTLGEEKDRKTVTLSASKGQKPVVLVFGSYT